MNLERKGGILLHISSLNGKYGIGTLGKEAYDFVDLLNSSKCKLWQILPLNDTSVYYSPYQGLSAFAGNPIFIDLDKLVERKIIEKIDWKYSESNYVNFIKVFQHRNEILKRAFEKIKNSIEWQNLLNNFFEKEKFWLEDYCIFKTLKELNKFRPLNKWKKSTINKYLKNRDNFLKEYEERIMFFVFQQYLFFSDWQRLKEYANSKNVQIIGDLPIYVSADSADVFAQPEYFSVDATYNCIEVAGVPPDYFSETGQLWGNPVYNWKIIEKDNFKWWIKRFEHNLNLFDYVRIDHFRGFSSYWAVRAEEKTAVKGKWKTAPGKKLFYELSKKTDLNRLIAEDLGIITEDVTELIDAFDFTTMKVLQFAFDGNCDNPHLPFNYQQNSIVYTGTHDNDTLKGWFDSLPAEIQQKVLSFLNTKRKHLNQAAIRAIWQSVARFAIIPIQDLFELNSDARLNTPNTVKGNWRWKLRNKDIDIKKFEFLKELNELYCR